MACLHGFYGLRLLKYSDKQVMIFATFVSFRGISCTILVTGSRWRNASDDFSTSSFRWRSFDNFWRLQEMVDFDFGMLGLVVPCLISPLASVGFSLQW
ncbi:MAG: hypothetical protein ACLS36_03625 [Streptococcus sp.]